MSSERSNTRTIEELTVTELIDKFNRNFAKAISVAQLNPKFPTWRSIKDAYKSDNSRLTETEHYVEKLWPIIVKLVQADAFPGFGDFSQTDEIAFKYLMVQMYDLSQTGQPIREDISGWSCEDMIDLVLLHATPTPQVETTYTITSGDTGTPVASEGPQT